MNKFLLYIILFFVSFFNYGQNYDYEKELEMALKPSKAAFYSAVLPGLGQAYNIGKSQLYTVLLQLEYIFIIKMIINIIDIDMPTRED
jgi:hypothetical protein